MEHPTHPSGAGLGIAIRQARHAQKRTIEDVAFEAHIHPTYLSGIERGVRNPSWSVVCALAGALGLSVALLAADAEAETRILLLAERVRRTRLAVAA